MKKIIVALFVGLLALILVVSIGFVTLSVQTNSASQSIASDTAVSQEKVLNQEDPLGAEEAKAAALADAGVSAVDDIRVELEVDDGQLVYEIDFLANGISYDYTLDAATCAILEKETEELPNPAPTLSEPTNDIGKEQAKRIALTHAGVAEKDADMIEVKHDSEEGRAVYEVEFRRATTEFEYTLDATNGDILEWAYDND